jgi:hypothetical protein
MPAGNSASIRVGVASVTTSGAVPIPRVSRSPMVGRSLPVTSRCVRAALTRASEITGSREEAAFARVANARRDVPASAPMVRKPIIVSPVRAMRAVAHLSRLDC